MFNGYSFYPNSRLHIDATAPNGDSHNRYWFFGERAYQIQTLENFLKLREILCLYCRSFINNGPPDRKRVGYQRQFSPSIRSSFGGCTVLGCVASGWRKRKLFVWTAIHVEKLSYNLQCDRIHFCCLLHYFCYLYNID